MRTPGRFRAKAVLGLLVSGCLAAEPDPAADGDRPPREIPGTPQEFPAAFSVVRAVMALPDGRVVVSDAQENRLTLIDFPKGTSRSLGRVGAGPGEFSRAGGLYRARGGGVVLFDHELRRLLPVLPSGELGEIVGLPTGGAAGFWSARGPDPLMVDSVGHTYTAIRSGGFTAPASVLLRYRPGAGPDTITRLLRTTTREVTGPVKGMEYQEVLFSPADAWTVSPDGRIAVVRAAPYRVEWIPLTGPVVTGPAVRLKPVPVTRREKELIASGAAGSRGRITVTIGVVPAGGAPTTPAGPPAPIPVGELLFAKAKTPVDLRAGSWPLLDESGVLWVKRSLPGGAKANVFDLFDRDGNLVDRIALPAGSRLVGFDRQWLYTVRIDADDFEHLQRFPLPR
ncbi:MAG TPA: hypothetical protein VFN96_10480 [Gemmatimonadales bacterium]|nr:hypothetical protein [Gemmatimonadales bacterium]